MGLSGSLCRSPRLMVINLVGDVGARIDRGESRDKLLRFAVVVVVGIDVRAAGWDRGTQNCRAEVRGGGGRGVRSSATLCSSSQYRANLRPKVYLLPRSGPSADPIRPKSANISYTPRSAVRPFRLSAVPVSTSVLRTICFRLTVVITLRRMNYVTSVVECLV